ncbi:MULTISPECIES: IS110 family transposase [unclassified Microcoleus]|uniref:IS110 family transposase n=1 Tax=unclassified Microcoleus TaxID=2642155 RepID=UPI004040CAC1
MLVWKLLASWREALAEFLYGDGFKVSIVNPARIKGFAKSELLRTKTDSVDAAQIARFCAAMKPSMWTPTAPEVKELQAGFATARIRDRNGKSRAEPSGNSYANCCWPYPCTLRVSKRATKTAQKTD